MKYEIIEEITTGGSDRRFYRIAKENKTCILIIDKHIGDYVKILRHLFNARIGVPEIIEVGRDKMIVEDLGRDSLYELMRSNNTQWRSLYLMAIDELINLQIDGRKDAPVNLYYDKEHIKWEQEYFQKFFLRQFCNRREKEIEDIEDDLNYLCKETLEAIRSMNDYLMHRDYQSQNIFIKDGRVRIIDFQSARIGPLTYDLASLLRDAYVEIDDDAEISLIEYYLGRLKERGINFGQEEFHKIYRLTAIQRNIQALGAFANLSLNKGKHHFRKFIPRGLELLNKGLKECRLNNLNNLIDRIIENLPKFID
ncbi:MAG: aminoglycoside phosphotransferase family protein [bacterium]